MLRNRQPQLAAKSLLRIDGFASCAARIRLRATAPQEGGFRWLDEFQVCGNAEAKPQDARTGCGSLVPRHHIDENL